MSQRDPFFIVGCPRSGTTLLSVMLDRHSHIAIPPETAFFDEIAPRFPASDGDIGALLAGWPRLIELNLTVDEVLHDAFQCQSPAALLKRILLIFCKTANAKRVGEKTPQHLAHVETIMQSFPDARVLCLMRDGRDVALSLAAMPWWSGGLQGAAEMWLAAEAQCTDFEARFAGRFLTISYEDLLIDTIENVTRATNFVGQGFEEAQLDERVESRVVLQRSLTWKAAALRRPDAALTHHRRSASRSEDLMQLDHHLGPALIRRGYLLLNPDQGLG